MAKERLYGTCKFCRQIRIISESELIDIKEACGDDYEPTQTELDSLASVNCDCEDSRLLQHLADIKLATKENITMLFSKDFTEEASLMNQIADLMCEGKISKVSLQLRHNTKATMARNNVGEIKIQKVVTDKNELLS